MKEVSNVIICAQTSITDAILVTVEDLTTTTSPCRKLKYYLKNSDNFKNSLNTFLIILDKHCYNTIFCYYTHLPAQFFRFEIWAFFIKVQLRWLSSLMVTSVLDYVAFKRSVKGLNITTK